MISTLHGKVASIGKDSIILDVSGFGIEVFASKSLISRAVVSEELFCCAYMQISDAGVNMFGFSTDREKILFLELLQVKTVGGKLAITLLRHLDVDYILQAISSGSTSMISVPGLGAKRAERICFELKNKIAKKFADLPESDSSILGSSSCDSFVLDALTGLGFTQSESSRAISLSKASSDDDVSWTEESLLKAALSVLQRNKRGS